MKIVTIGGGSSYTPELVEGLIERSKTLPVSEFWLVDIEEGREKLEIISDLAKRMVEKAGLPMKIIPTLNRQEALEGADFVTTQIRVGLMDARIKDERIPLSMGLLGQETNGAGGMFKALRTIPVILDIVKDIQKLCPNAWMINFTNPAAMVSESIIRHTDYKKSIGLCNVPIGMHYNLAKLLDVEPSRLRLEIQGSNHFIFVTNVFVDGVSVFEKALEVYLADKPDTPKNIHQMKFSDDLIYGLNAIPCSYLNYYFFQHDQLQKQLEEYDNGMVRAQAVKKVEEELFELYRDTELATKPEQLSERGGAHYSVAACNLISSLYNNTCDVQYVNIRNNGTISNLSDDVCIEAACMITKDGAKPLALGALKPEINGMIQMMKAFDALAIQAAVYGDRRAAIAALNINPLITSDNLAHKVFDALLEGHKDYLPQF